MAIYRSIPAPSPLAEMVGNPSTADLGRQDAPARSQSAGEAAPARDAELNAQVLSCPLHYVRNQFGQARLDQLIREAGGEPATFASPYGWISHALFERVLEGVRQLVPTDQEFCRACAYEMKESYGPLGVLLRMSSIKQMYRLLASTIHVVSKISRFEVEDRGRGHVRIRYTSTRNESRLMCLSRQSQNRAIPGIWWGVPPPTIEEHRCIAWGDPDCCYDLRWKEPIRWRIATVGAIAGAGLGLAAMLAGADSWTVPLSALAGLAVAWVIELRRVVADNQRVAEDTREALLTLTESHQEAAHELIDLHRRQQVWNQELENLIAARTATLEAVVTQLRSLKQSHHTRVQSLSHDIRNPLTVIKATGALLRDELCEADSDLQGSLADIVEASDRIEVLLTDLARVAEVEPANASGRPEVVDVALLAETLRRRLKAIVFGRDIRPTVFHTRKAPGEIRVDAVLLDRVLDNLLTNAAKYTERGSILVELDGVAGYLCLRISDTGRGIAEERLKEVFHGTAPDTSPAVGTSLGLGLSVVVRTLAQLNGRLEVMSRLGQGSTFWLYVPVEPTDGGPERRSGDESLADLVRRVIKIREAM